MFVISCLDEYQNLQRIQDEMANSEKTKVREVNHLEVLIDAEKKNVEHVQTEISTKKKDLEHATENLKSTNTALNQVNHNASELVDRKKSLEKNLATMNQQLINVQREHSETRSKVQTQDAKVQNLRQKSDLLNARDATLSADVKRIEEKIQNKTEKITKSNQIITSAKEKIGNTLQAQENGQTIVQIAKEEATSIDNEIKNLDAQIVTNENEINRMREKLRQSNDMLAANETVKMANYERLEKLEKSMTELKMYHCNLQKKYQNDINRLANEQVKVRQQQHVAVNVEPIRQKK
ncbi:unnamed protein product [Rotaria magnacalcarata]|nr:unnamed protein product [Rotaria magnacalcarata]